MRVVPNTKLKRPRFLYNIVDANGDYLVDVLSKRLTFYKDTQNIDTVLTRVTRPQTTTLKRPRYTYNLKDVNGDYLLDILGKRLVCYKDEQNINNVWSGLGKRDEIFTWDYDYYPWNVDNFPWSGIIKGILKRPRFTYTLIDTNENALVDTLGKRLTSYQENQNINTIWR